MQVNSWNVSAGANLPYLSTVGALRGAGEQKVKSYMPDWDKVKEAVVARLPQAQEFARRALAGAVGASSSILGGTVVSLAMGRPTMSASQIVGYAAASGVVSACTANVPSAAFVHGVGIGLVAQFAFSHAMNKGNQAVAEEQKKWNEESLTWKAENNRLHNERLVSLTGTQCKPGLYKTNYTDADVEPDCTFDPSNKETSKTFSQQQFGEMYRGNGVLVDCEVYEESDYNEYCAQPECAEKFGDTYDIATLDKLCRERGFKEPWGGLPKA